MRLVDGVDERAEPTRNPASRVLSLLLTVTAVLGTVCIVATVAGAVLDVKPLIFRSGSMAPSIGTGALGMARTTPAADLRVGDVVSVVGPEGTRITHRIRAIDPVDGGASLVLKGDANAKVDPAPYEVATVDRVMFDVPGLGYAVAWTTGAGGMVLGGLVGGLVLLVVFGSGTGGSTGGARRATVGTVARPAQPVA